jgi:hypothetical protein
LSPGKPENLRRIRYILPVLFLLLTGCPVPQVLPDTPSIQFKSFILDKGFDGLGNEILLGELRFDFEDGDGDIGFEVPSENPDTLDFPDSLLYNLFLTPYEKVDGQFVEVDTSELETPPYYRIPPLDREGQNKTLKGEVMISIQYLLIEYDTLKYSFYIMDRAFHRSNVDTTSEIIFTDWID